MKASDLLVKCLENEGVDYIFGVPGEENADLMLSLEDSPIRFVLTRHEQGAAFMAETHGRLTGKAGVCLGTLGPGASNLITGVANANMDRAPLIVITGQAATTRQHKESHQVMDVVNMYEPVTKWSHAIQSARHIPEVVRRAFKLAEAEKPGAVHIELPEDIAKMDASSEPLTPVNPRRPVPDEKSINRVWDAIQSSKSPIIVAGNGTIRRRASKQLRRFCEATGIGVISTFMAKGCVDADADYCLFTIGLQQKDFTNLAIENADLVIVLGYDMVEYPPHLWNTGKDKRIVHIDFLPAEADEHYQPEVEVVGDLAHSLWMLNELISDNGTSDFDLSVQHDVRKKMLQDFQDHAQESSQGSITPQKLLWDVRQVLGPDDIVLSGVGAHKMWIARYFQCHQPGTCIIPNGFCSMGMPLPGAIAASIVCPDVNVLGIVGDGDFLMNVQEMETAKRLNSRITMLIWQDNAYGLIAWKQQQEFGTHTDLSFQNPDWIGLAKSFGWEGQWVEDADGFADALSAALNRNGPNLIAVPVDYRENMKLSKRLGDLTVSI